MSAKISNSSSGDVVYGRKVLNSIITLAAQEINGVASLHGKGIRAEIYGNSISVDVFMNVYLGVSCSDVAFRVQENIKRSVESMTSYKVDVININILGVVFKEKSDEGTL